MILQGFAFTRKTGLTLGRPVLEAASSEHVEILERIVEIDRAPFRDVQFGDDIGCCRRR